jgi:hypothetical protein
MAFHEKMLKTQARRSNSLNIITTPVIQHRRADITMPCQLTHNVDISALLQQAGNEGST